MNPDLILRRAAEFQKMTDPDDALSRLVNRVLEETELSEEELDFVAAAAQPLPAQDKPGDKKR